MTDNHHIHTPGDGRGYRDVFVDGRRVERVFFADTRRGIVDSYRYPLKVHRHGKRAISRRLRGDVVVVFKSGADDAGAI